MLVGLSSRKDIGAGEEDQIVAKCAFLLLDTVLRLSLVHDFDWFITDKWVHSFRSILPGYVLVAS